MEDLEAAYQQLPELTEALEAASGALESRAKEVIDETYRLRRAYNDHGDALGAFMDSVITNISLDFFDYADHKSDCKRRPCTCGYQSAREYATRIYKQATDEDPPDTI